METGEWGTGGVAGSVAVAGLLLAAGEGRRFGSPKALLEISGERLVDRGTRILHESGCAPVHVVTGAIDVDVGGAHQVRNPRWDTGMGSSLRVGLESLPEEVDAVVVSLADQPLITARAVRRLITAYEEGARVVVATYGGNPRNPVLLGREHWPTVHALAEGDVGARPFLRAYSHLVTLVDCDDVAHPDDIDTPEDLRRVCARMGCADNHPD